MDIPPNMSRQAEGVECSCSRMINQVRQTQTDCSQAPLMKPLHFFSPYCVSWWDRNFDDAAPFEYRRRGKIQAYSNQEQNIQRPLDSRLDTPFKFRWMHPEHCNEELVGCYPLCEEDSKKVSAIKMNNVKHLIKMKKHPNLGGNIIRLKIGKSQGYT